MYPKNAISMFSPKCHNCTMCQCFQNTARATQYAALHNTQPKVHNSADRGNSKFVYLRLRLVVCFCPRLLAWPWSWGHTYRQIASIGVCGVGVVASLSTFRGQLQHFHIDCCETKYQGLENIIIRGCIIFWSQGLIIPFGTSRSLFKVSWSWRTLLHWKRSFVSRLIIIN